MPLFPQSASFHGSHPQGDGGERERGPNPEEVFEAVLDSIDLVISDMTVPVMTGIALFKKLR